VNLPGHNSHSTSLSFLATLHPAFTLWTFRLCLRRLLFDEKNFLQISHIGLLLLALEKKIRRIIKIQCFVLNIVINHLKIQFQVDL